MIYFAEQRNEKKLTDSAHCRLMSLNSIQLNSSLLTGMYKESLVEDAELHQKLKTPFIKAEADLDKLKRNESKHRDWDYLGEYKKSVLLIVRYPNATCLPDVQLNFLASMLTACKLGLVDVAILNISTAPSNHYKTIYDQFKSRVMILFGITPEEFAMPVNFPEFQVQAFNNCTFLHTPILEALESDKVLKSKLWVCLRRIFDLA